MSCIITFSFCSSNLRAFCTFKHSNKWLIDWLQKAKSHVTYQTPSIWCRSLVYAHLQATRISKTEGSVLVNNKLRSAQHKVVEAITGGLCTQLEMCSTFMPIYFWLTYYLTYIGLPFVYAPCQKHPPLCSNLFMVNLQGQKTSLTHSHPPSLH